MVNAQKTATYNMELNKYAKERNFSAMHALQQERNNSLLNNRKNIKKSDIKCKNNLHTLCKSIHKDAIKAQSNSNNDKTDKTDNKENKENGMFSYFFYFLIESTLNVVYY